MTHTSGVQRLSRTAGRSAEAVLDAALHLPGDFPAVTGAVARTGRVASAAMLHPEALLERAQKLSKAVPMLRQAVAPILTGRVDWRAEYAYTAGVQAFVFGFPYVYYAQLRHDWVTKRRDPAVVPYAAVNHFWHAGRLLDASYRDGGCPNTDTLYSVAWLDLSGEPVILSHPDMGERYFTFQLVGFTSDNFDYVGQRTTGSDAGDFAIVGPDWQGELPPGVRRVRQAPTPWALVLGRTAVDGAGDLRHAHSLQRQYHLTPLSLWGGERAAVPDRRDVYAPTPTAEDPLSPWKTLNAMLAENPPPPHHARLLDQLGLIGIGPGLDVEAQPAAVKEGLLRAATTGMALLRQQFTSGDWATVVDGWRYPPPEEGRFGDDFLRRAADQALAGIAAHDPQEAVYLLNFQDGDGAKLTPQGHYELHFDADGLPPVDAFWSLSAYTAHDLNLIGNSLNRYSISDRTPGTAAGRGRWPHRPAAGGTAGRTGGGCQLAADLENPSVVRDPEDVPAALRGRGRHLEMPCPDPSA